MWISDLEIINFRNYDIATLKLDKGINAIIGENGVGKTSLVESISYLPLCKSLRGAEDKELIKFEKDFSRIKATIVNEHKSNLNIVLTSKSKRIELDDVAVKKVSEIAGICRVVSFLPKDVELFKEQPLKRRKFIDQNLSIIDKTYLKLLTEYNKILNDLRVVLKEEEKNKELIFVLMESLSTRGEKIQKIRECFINSINEYLKNVAKYLEDNNTKMEVIYHPDVEYGDDYTNICVRRLKTAIENRVNSRILIPGIHSDDISFKLNGIDIATFGSQGQNRLSVIAVKLSLFKLINDKFNDNPIVILDDVLSELDDNHQMKLIKLLSNIEQVFITGTKLNLEQKLNLYIVEGNDVRRKN